MAQQPVLIFDIDGTLLHQDNVEDAIAIAGRTRSSYIAQHTVSLLHMLSGECHIVLATGRSWSGTQPIVHVLRQHGIDIAGLVLENGGLFGTENNLQPLNHQQYWATLRDEINHAREQIGVAFSWRKDFVTCLALSMENASDAVRMEQPLLQFAQQHIPTVRSHVDGRKLFLLAENANKWHALEALLGSRAKTAFGVGDGLNDAHWLSRIALPCTLSGCHPHIYDIVQRAGGKVACGTQHTGTAEILLFFCDTMLDNSKWETS